MPQDVWRASGVEYASPDAHPLDAVAANEAFVYIGENPSGSDAKVLQFDVDGTFIRRFSDNFGNICGLSVDAAGNVYVLDAVGETIRKYTADGSFLLSWGSEGSGNGQFSISDTEDGNFLMDITPDGEVYVADPGNTRVQVFDTSGTFLRAWGEPGPLDGQFPSDQPDEIFVSNNPTVYTSNKIFDGQGTFIESAPSFVRSVSPDNVFLYFSSSRLVTWRLPGRSTGLVYDNPYDQSPSGRFNAAWGAFDADGNFYGLRSSTVRQYMREYETSPHFIDGTPIPQPVVLSAAQRSGTMLVDIDYIVYDSDDATVETGLLAFVDGDLRIEDAVQIKTFAEGTETHVGPGQPTGQVRSVVWNMPADWAVDFADIRIEALAKDTRNLLGAHWITIPAHNGLPEIQVAREPYSPDQLWDAMFYLLATRNDLRITPDPRGGNWAKVIGENGLYNGLILAADGPSSSRYDPDVNHAGVTLIGSEIGARPITYEELQRARAGNYGFLELTQRTLVKDARVPTAYLRHAGQMPGMTNPYMMTLEDALLLPLYGPPPAQLAARDRGIFYRLPDGIVRYLGEDGSYLGLSPEATSFFGASVQFAENVAFMASSGGSHTLYVTDDNRLMGLGSNSAGQLGYSPFTSTAVPVQVATQVARAWAGSQSTVYLDQNAALWGLGRLHNVGTYGDTATQIDSSVIDAAVGGSHLVYVKSDGTLWGIGRNSSGQLGLGAVNSVNSPTQIDTGVIAVAAGASHSIYLRSDNTLWGMGGNSSGSLGQGDQSTRSTPVQIDSNVVEIAAGNYHILYRKNDGSVYSCGDNVHGQLGDGTFVNRSTPVQVDGNATTIAAGPSSSAWIRLP